MHFESWSAGETDPGRLKRLAIGYLVGLAMMAGISVVAASVHRTLLPPEEEEEVLDVKLADEVPESKPEPPPPPPAPAPKPHAAVAGRRALLAPTAVPTELPPEVDPKNAKGPGDDAYGDYSGVAGGQVGGAGTGTVAAAPPPPEAPPPPPPPPPPPRPRGPVHLPENATPPQALHRPNPPAHVAAKLQGATAAVIVRFVITESGEVTSVKVVRGHPLIDDQQVIATVRTWRYKPAVFEGKPIQIFRTEKIVFKMKS